MKKLLLVQLTIALFSVQLFAQNVGIGTNDPKTKLDINGSLSLREGQAISTLVNGNNDNVVLPDILGSGGTKSSFYRITAGPTAAFAILGIVPYTGADGQMVTLVNTTGQVMTLKNNASTTPANSFTTLTGSDYVSVAGNSSITIQYNKATSRWYVTGSQNYTVAATSLATKDIVPGTGSAVTIVNGTNQVVGGGNVVLDVTTNALNQKGIVPGPTSLNSNQAYLTDVNGNPTWAKIPNTHLNNSSITVSPGTGMSGGGNVALGGTITLTNTGDLSNTNEGALTVGTGTATTSVISSNTSGSTDVTLEAGSNVTLTETGNKITIASANSGGTVTNVATGAGLTGGPITTTGTISIPNAGVTNVMLANPSLTVTAGTGMSGGGSVALGGSVTLTNAGVTSIVAGTNVTVSGATGAVTINSTGSGLTGASTANYVPKWTTTSATSGNLSNNTSSIFDNGKVGIGTTTPNTALEVYSAGSGAPTNSDPQTMQLYLNDSRTAAINVGGGLGFAGKYNSTGSIAGFASIWGAKENSTDGDFASYMAFATRLTGGANAVLERMRISSAGNVGIGTTTPGQKLEVAGNGKFTGNYVYVGSGGGAYYGDATNMVVHMPTGGNFYMANVGTDGTRVAQSDGSLRVGGPGQLTPTLTVTGMGSGLVKATSGLLSIAGASDIPSGSGNYIQNQTAAAQAGAGFNTAGSGMVGTTMQAATYQFPAPAGDPSPVITARTVPAGQGSSAEKTELILFHSNDNATGSGVDQITLRAPGLSFQTYPNNGVSDINNALGYNERMYINPDGLVGVGTNAPGYMFHITKASSADLVVENTGAGASKVALTSSSSTSTGGVGSVSNTDFPIFTNNVDRIMITAAGNVGVGNMAPTYKFQVSGGNTRIAATGAEQSLFGLDQIVGLNDLRFYTDDAGTTEIMHISASNVGIGTTTTTNKLEVAGDINASSGFKISNAATAGNYLRGDGTRFVSSAIQAGDIPNLNGTYVDLSNTQTAGGVKTWSAQAKFSAAIQPSSGNAATNGVYFATNIGGGTGDEAWQRYYVESGENTKLQIGINNDADDDISFYQAGAERMNIYNGNVGIGNTLPAYLLDVNGVINSATGFKVAGGTPSTSTYLKGNGTNFVAGSILAADIPSLSGTYVDLSNTQTANGAKTWGSAAVFSNSVTASDYGAPGVVNVRVGDDSYFTDVDVANMVGLYGNTNTVGGLQLGNSSGAYVYGSGGNIGIGITNPIFTLSTGNSGTVATSILRLQNSYLQDNSGNYGIQLAGIDNGTNGHDLRIQGRTTSTGAFSDLMTVKNSGNVGIGTIAPADKLHIFGNSAKLIIDNGTNATSDIGIVFKNGDVTGSEPKSAIISKGYNSWKRADMYFVLDGAADAGPYDVTTDTKMLIKAESGNVGIGITAPASKLEVRSDGTGASWAGRLALSNSTADRQIFFGTYNGNSCIASHNYALSAWKDLYLNSVDGTTATANVIISTKLGIGTAAPSIALDVALGATIGSSAMSVSQHDVSNRGTKVRFGSTSGDYAGMNVVIAAGTNSCGNTADLTFNTWECNTSVSREVARINGRGYLGIGTAAPNAPLEVATISGMGGNQTGTGFAYFATGGNTFNSGAAGSWANNLFSIIAGGRILCRGEIDVLSDKRIKNIEGISNPVSDLETLNKIEVTDFKYKDKVEFGGETKKGFIAQQVEANYPQAITKRRDFIPDIYELTNQVCYNDKDSTLTVNLAKEHHLAMGDNVRFISNDGNKKEAFVIEINSTTEFTVKGWSKPDNELFVYGKEIHDLEVVDYDRIYTLNVSATQELARKVAALEKENAQLKDENCDIKYGKADAGDVNELRIQLQELKQLMQKNGIRTEK